MECCEMKISGRVQRVGFRYFTMQAALQWGVKGWVKNMPDGSVLCHAQGDAGAMKAFRAEVRKGPSFGRVDEIEETSLPETTQYTDFQITY